MPFLEKINHWLDNVAQQYEQQVPPPNHDSSSKQKLTASQKKMNKAIMEDADSFLLSSLISSHKRGSTELVDLLTNNPNLCQWLVDHLDIQAYRKLPKEVRDIIDKEVVEE